jgi:hypothetical protein
MAGSIDEHDRRAPPPRGAADVLCHYHTVVRHSGIRLQLSDDGLMKRLEPLSGLDGRVGNLDQKAGGVDFLDGREATDDTARCGQRVDAK